jgi:hypothetical protein
VDEPYYVAFSVDGLHIGLDPNGHSQGMTGPVGYWHVDDIRKSLKALLDAGAVAQQEVKDVGGGKLIATEGRRRQRHRPHPVGVTAYSLHPIGHIRSTLRAPEDAPRQGSE